MKNTRFGILFFLALLILPAFIHAADFGLLLNQYGGFGNYGNDDNFYEYQAGLVPRFSFLIGETGSFFASASMNVEYKDKFYYYPELLRTELALRYGAFGIKAGRINYSAPVTFIAEGLFDGFQFSHTSSAGHLGFGAWYTGFQYKKSANIMMTAEDQTLYDSPLDYSDFFNTYFAPGRLLASLSWEHPSIGEFLQLNAALLGQLDMTKGDGKYHSQYFIFKAGIPIKGFLFEAGGSVEAAQIKKVQLTTDAQNTTDKMVDDEFKLKLAFTGEAGLYFTIPANFSSTLSFTGCYTTGVINDLIGAFVPVTTKYSGEIFKAKMTGLTVLGLDYSARLADSFGFSLTALYFFRNDLVTANNYLTAGEITDNKLLGGELYAKLIWNPFSDLQLRLGGGAFFPSMGNVSKDGKTLWKIDIIALLAIL